MALDPKVLELERQIKELQAKVDALYSPAGFPNSILETLVQKGFLRFNLYDVITYTNPSGKDFHSIFVKYQNRIGLVSFDINYRQIESVNVSTDVLTLTKHGFSDTNQVQLATAGTPPTPLSPATIYYVRDSTANTFKLALSSGGAAVNITNAGSGATFISYV